MAWVDDSKKSHQFNPFDILNTLPQPIPTIETTFKFVPTPTTTTSNKSLNIQKKETQEELEKRIQPKTDADQNTFDIETDTIDNKDYRRVIYTGQFQLVYMSLKPDEEIGMEKHIEDQFFKVEAGYVFVTKGDKTTKATKGWSTVIKGGVLHNLKAGPGGAKLYTIYAPAHHPKNKIQSTKPTSEQEASEEGTELMDNIEEEVLSERSDFDVPSEDEEMEEMFKALNSQ
jgi:mannose-6-phosphate isomerase-like protein (cupin superfamily)